MWTAPDLSKASQDRMSEALEKAERDLLQARRIMVPGRPRDDSEEWLLLATLIGEADLAFQEARRRDPTLAFPLIEAVVAEFYEMTSGFTDPVFLRQTRAARRRNRALFRAGPWTAPARRRPKRL